MSDDIVRSQDEFGDPHGLPWGVSPWGDGSSTTGNSNIISDRWQVVIASEMPTETAEFIVASVNEIERLRGARGWQLIESAPRDGSLIDLWMRSYFWTADGDKQLSVQQRVPEAIWFNGQWTNSDGNPHEYLDGFTDYELSHWMPLPSPPAGE